MDVQAQQLHEEVQRLRDAIAETSKGDAQDDSDWEARLPHRRRLQHELEGALLKLAEVEETSRMKSAIQAAVRKYRNCNVGMIHPNLVDIGVAEQYAAVNALWIRTGTAKRQSRPFWVMIKMDHRRLPMSMSCKLDWPN
jgi:hypothetical protein